MNTLHDDVLFTAMSRLPFDDDANFQRSYAPAARLRKERQIHSDKAELLQFAERLRNNPRLDDIIHRLKTTPYPNRTLMGVELKITSIADVLDRAIDASLGDIQGEQEGWWGPNKFGDNIKKAAIARLIFRVIDAVLCPEQIENTPPYDISYNPIPLDAANPSPTARTIETQETNDHRRLRFVFESIPVGNDRTRDLLKVVYMKPDGGNEPVFDREILITTESQRRGGQPFSVRQFVERLMRAEQIVEFNIGTQTPTMYHNTPLIDRSVIRELIRYILEEARLFHVADGRVMVSSAFSDLAI